MNGLSVEQVHREVADMIHSNPVIGDTSKILVDVAKTGPIFMRKPRVQLEGTVDREIFKQKIEKQIAEKYGDAVEIASDLKVAG